MTRTTSVSLAFALISITATASAVSAQGDGAKRDPTITLPLEPTRPLRFTTDEGSWMSIDVSPDGGTLVFDILGDLYTLPIAGGKATRITSGQAYDSQPRFSPDGRRIVFVSDRNGSDNIWIANANGSDLKQLTKTKWYGYISPEWTPDGSYIVTSRNNRDRYFGPFELWLHHVDGGSGQKLTGGTGATGQFLGATFGKDPRYIWVTSGSSFGGVQVGTFDRQTGQATARTNTRPAGAFSPLLSPDGKWLVFATRRGPGTSLRLHELSSWSERWLVHGVQHDATEGGSSRDFMPGMSFTPDSKAIIASYDGKIKRIDVPSGQVTDIPFTADVDQMIGPLVQFDYPVSDSVLNVRQIREARISPDRSKVVFTALDRVWVADVPAGAAGDAAVTIANAKPLATLEGTQHSAVWSPDGRSIAFVTWNDASGDIYRIGADGSGQPQKLTTQSAFYEKLAYSPNGSRLIFIRGPAQLRTERRDELALAPAIGVELLWMPASGGEPKLIAPVNIRRRFNPTYYGIPHFGHDTSRVVIYDATEGLVSMRFDGMERRVHLEATSLEWSSWATGGQDPADDIVLSPNGENAVIVGNQNVFLATLPLLGPAPKLSTVGRAGAAVPFCRITRVGGDFPAWDADGKTFSYSLGASIFRYDLAKADAARADSARARPDSGASRSAAKKAAYEPARWNVVINVPADRPKGAVLLRGARIITMKGDEVIQGGDILVRDNRIAAIGRRGQVAVPSGARVVDVTGKTIIPGYVDIHAHMWPTWGVHRTQVWEYLANLAYGVTATRDPQTMTSDVIDYSDRVASGELLGPRIFTTARGVFASEEINSQEDARDVLRRYSEFYKTETIKQYLVGDRDRRQWVAIAAKEQQLTPTNEGGGDFKLNITHMMDGYSGVEHSIPTFPFYKDVVQLAATSGTTYTPTLIVSYGGASAEAYFVVRYDMPNEPKLKRFWPRDILEGKANRYSQWMREDEYAFHKIAAQAAKIVAAGGRVGLGGHGNVQGLGVHFELWGFAMGGMKPHDVLRVGTIFPAEAIGHGKDLGSLQVGKLADLQVLDGNPLVNIRNTNTVRYVMKNGRLYDANTLDEIWPRQQKLAEQWWMRDR